MKLFCYKLNFKSSFHLAKAQYKTKDSNDSNLDKNFNFIHSDTLYSAILALWNNFYDDKIDDIVKRLPFIVSSCFPYQNEKIYFPNIKSEILEKEAWDKIKECRKKVKELKKFVFVKKDIFEKILKGEKLSSFEELKNGVLKENDYLEKVLNVRLGLEGDKGQKVPFYFADTYLKQDYGLYFLVRFNELEFKNKFEAILRLLGDEGIGADRTSGKGSFQIKEIKEIDFNIDENNQDYFINLSLYTPNENEDLKNLLDDKNVSYELVKRGGWITQKNLMNEKKKDFLAFKESSIFAGSFKEDRGQVLEIQQAGKDYKIYRILKPICLPIKIQNKEK